MQWRRHRTPHSYGVGYVGDHVGSIRTMGAVAGTVLTVVDAIGIIDNTVELSGASTTALNVGTAIYTEMPTLPTPSATVLAT